MLRLVFSRIKGFLLLLALLCAAGVVMFDALPVLMYPQTRRPMVTVRFSHPGMSAIDFRDQYAADSIEPALTSMDNVDLVETTYSSDSSSITITFDWEIDGDAARDQVVAAMNGVRSYLPEDLRDAYSIRFREGENAGFIVMGVVSNATPPEELMPMLQAGVESRLATIDGVDEYGIYGLEELSVEVTLDHEAMLAAGVSMLDVDAAFRAGLSPSPLGTLREGDERYSLRLRRPTAGLESLGRLEIARDGLAVTRLEDIAEIDVRYDLPSRVFLLGDKPAIQITLTPEDGGNLNRMTEELVVIMEEAKASGRLPADVGFELYLDPAKYINRSISNVVQSALLGGLLAVLIVFLILGELRNTLIIALTVPVTIVLSFILMSLFGLTINLISLGGLALAVGMIVDPTIVVMENIHRWRAEARRAGDASGSAAGKDLVADATRQVRGPVIASALTSVAVFLPLTFTAPLAAAILGDQAKTVVFSLLVSLLVSLSFVPVAAYLLFGTGKRAALSEPRGYAKIADAAMDRLVEAYRRALRAVIRTRPRAATFLTLAFAALVVSVGLLLPRVPKEMLPTPSSDRVVVFFRHGDYTTAPEVIERLMPELRERIAGAMDPIAYKDFASVSGRMNQIFVDLESTEYTDEAIVRLEAEFESEGQWYFSIASWDPAALPLPQTNDLRLSVHGPDPTVKVALLDEMQRALNDSRLYGRTYARPSPALTREVALETRPGAFDGFPGLGEASMATLVRRSLAGSAGLSLSDGSSEVSVSATYPDGLLDSRDELARFLVPWKGTGVPLKHFFDFEESETVSQVYSENGEAAYRLYANISGEASDAVRLEKEAAARRLFDSAIEPPAGYGYSFDNPRGELDEAISSLLAALAISIGLVYLLLAFQYDSFGVPLAILVAVPFGFVGVALSLFAFRSTLNLNSLLGTILLCGVVVNNSIIMIDFYLKTRKNHQDNASAIEAAAALRLKPILITTLTTVFGMLPIALGMGSGSNILQPLGIAVSGGLAISTLLTLFAVPALLRFWRFPA